ncbi:hypothetical protein THASP1DRAFT_25813, partial [Thamnocephalis sphaerospora]
MSSGRPQLRGSSTLSAQDRDRNDRNSNSSSSSSSSSSSQTTPNQGYGDGGGGGNHGASHSRTSSLGHADFRIGVCYVAAMVLKPRLTTAIQRIELQPNGTPTYLTAEAKPSIFPPRKFCS